MLICKATFGLVMVKWWQEIVFVLSMGETREGAFMLVHLEEESGF